MSLFVANRLASSSVNLNPLRRTQFSFFSSLLRKSSTSSSSNENIISSGLPDVEIPKTSIPELILPRFQFDNYIATECGLSGRKYTFGDVRSKSKNLGKNLRKRLNLNEGDVIAIHLPNVPEYAIIIMGALQAGLVVTTLNPLYTAEEIARQLVDSSAKAVITLTFFWDVAQTYNALLNKPLPIIAIKSQQSESLPAQAIDFAQFADTPLDIPDFTPRKPEDIAIMPYSSGTTGLPKGVELTHRNLVANIAQNCSSDVVNYLSTATSTHQDVIPAILPQYHIYGLTILTLITLHQQSKVVTLPRFVPNEFVDMLKKQKPNILFVVPPLVLFLASSPSVKREDLASLEVVTCGAAPLGALDEERFLEKAGKSIDILQGYGLSEASPVVTSTIRDDKKRTGLSLGGTIGKPIPNTLLKVINPEDGSGTALGPKQVGELLVKGPQVMKGYHNKPEETEKTFLDGWLRTGDMVYYNEENFLFVTDRLKELIKVKGFQVPPAELEEIIRNYPNVEDAAVVGIAHEKHGEVPRAYVVPKKNTKIDLNELDKFVSGKVAEYKRLAGGIALTDAIPKNASGKILRRALRLDYEKSLNK